METYQEFFNREGDSKVQLHDFSGCDVFIKVEDLYQMFKQRLEAEARKTWKGKPS